MSGRYFYTVEQIDQMLVARMDGLVRRLAPDGERKGCEWVALNPARPDRTKGSFSINLVTGVWKDFASDAGAKTLPGLGLVAYLATEGDFSRAIMWAKDWLGLTGKAPDAALTAKLEAQAKKSNAERERAREGKLRAAFAIYLEGRPLDGTDPASLYLRERGIDPLLLAEQRFPRSLKFHHAITHRTHAGKFPALVACQSLEGRKSGFAGIHRIYLAEVNGRWEKAFNGDESKVTLGYQMGASIRIAAGASGKKLSQAPAGEWVHACEGIEDALSLSIALPEARIVAAYSIGAIGNLILPATIGGVVIVADNDDPNSEAESALEYAALKLCDRHAVKIARMPDLYKDVNDCLTGKRKA